jgi:hypothetical protein
MFFLSNMLKPTINLKAFGEDKITENKFIFWSSRKTRKQSNEKYIRRIMSTLCLKYKKTFEISWILIVGNFASNGRTSKSINFEINVFLLCKFKETINIVNSLCLLFYSWIYPFFYNCYIYFLLHLSKKMQIFPLFAHLKTPLASLTLMFFNFSWVGYMTTFLWTIIATWTYIRCWVG